MRYSILIPVYDRPDEVRELLDSLLTQPSWEFEVVIVEDGSSEPCKDVVETYKDRLTVKYLAKENGGPSAARNHGASHAEGDYLLILDSDIIVPKGYIEAIDKELSENPCDAFGGPDRAHPSFTDTQKAISYAMTSFFTTGGIRGGKKKLDKFYPRSFNMGIRREAFTALGGFATDMRFGEDIDFSIRIFQEGYSCRLFPDAWVYHKRRTDFRKFFRQVHNSGIARINLHKRHPGSMKLVHLLPAAFTIGSAVLLVAGFFWPMAWLPLALYAVLIFMDAMAQNLDPSSTCPCCSQGKGKVSAAHAAWIGLLSIAASFVQLIGYGTGFLRAWWERCALGKGPLQAYKRNFYK